MGRISDGRILVIPVDELNYIITDFYGRMEKDGKPFVPNMTTIFDIIADNPGRVPLDVYRDLCNRIDSVERGSGSLD